MRALAVVAHPDDEVLGVGGTLLRHHDALDEVAILIIRSCSTRGYDLQRSQSQEAARRLGIPSTFEPDAFDLSGFVQGFRPDIVYTHSLADLHADHRAVHEQVLVACRPQSGVEAVYAFETPSATDWGMRPFLPTRFVDVTTTLERKLDALDAYESELRHYPHPRNRQSLRHRAAYWGQRAGAGDAEAFEVIREIW